MSQLIAEKQKSITSNIFSKTLHGLNVLLRPFNLVISNKGAIDELEKTNILLAGLQEIYTSPITTRSEHPAEFIIFSMDRPLQLHALVASYLEKVKHTVPVHVLYKSSSANYQKAYEEVTVIFKNFDITFIRQENDIPFRKYVTSILESIRSRKVFFLVDDIIFKDDFDILDISGIDPKTSVFSLRMGANLKRSDIVQKNQELPPFIGNAAIGKDKLCWLWGSGELDWGYPLSVDGHLFAKDEILYFINLAEFNTPNTLEAYLQTYAKYFMHRQGICYNISKIVNIPLNRVQKDFNNRHGSLDPQYLLVQWSQGMQMDYRCLYGYINESVHEDIQIRFVQRAIP